MPASRRLGSSGEGATWWGAQSCASREALLVSTCSALAMDLWVSTRPGRLRAACTFLAACICRAWMGRVRSVARLSRRDSCASFPWP